MKDENRTLTLDDFDHRLIVRALNDLRTDQVQQKKPTEDIDDLMLNSLGFLLGYGIYLLVKVIKRIHKRRKGRK